MIRGWSAARQPAVAVPVSAADRSALLFRPRSSGTTPTSVASPATHRTGSASVAATTTVQRRFGAGAPDDDDHGQGEAQPQRDGERAGLVDDLRRIEEEVDPVGPQLGDEHVGDRADDGRGHDRDASSRHSRRTTNQSRPMPIVNFVSRTNVHVHGCRKPSTTATASRRWMLP